MELKKYVAMDHNGSRITSVGAANEQHAKAMTRDQLDRPGRRQYLASWMKGGMVVTLEEKGSDTDE